MLASLEYESALMGTDDFYTLESVIQIANEQTYKTRKLEAIIQNFKDVVETNNSSFGVFGNDSEKFTAIMEAIQNNPIVHEEFNKWAQNKRYLFESVFYQSTFKVSQRYGELESWEKGQYTLTHERSHEENLKLVIKDLSKILEKYNIEY